MGMCALSTSPLPSAVRECLAADGAAPDSGGPWQTSSMCTTDGAGRQAVGGEPCTAPRGQGVVRTHVMSTGRRQRRSLELPAPGVWWRTAAGWRRLALAMPEASRFAAHTTETPATLTYEIGGVKQR